MAAVPVMVKVIFVLLAIGLIIFLIGFASPYWYYLEYSQKPIAPAYKYREGVQNLGLWQQCDEFETWDRMVSGKRMGGHAYDACWSLVGRDYNTGDELIVAQFFETVGLLAALLSLLLLVLSYCVNACMEKRILPIFSAIFCLAAAACVIIGTIVFGTDDIFKHHLSWAFALTIVGGIIFAVAGVLIIIGSILKK